MSAAPERIDVSGLGRPIRGPSALGGDFKRFVHLTRTLATSDFKLRFFGSVLGYFWQLMRPLLLFGVLYVVFTQALKLGTTVDFYPVVLLTSIVLFTFFSEATSAAVSSVVDRENLVRKIQFPRLVVPTTVVVTAAFNLGLNFLVVLVFMFASGVSVHLTWLELPVIIFVLAALAMGIAMLVSALYVRFRDVRPIWDVGLQVIFYGSPVIYAIETIPEGAQHVIMRLNPLAPILQQMRHAVIDPNAPNAAQAAGGYVWLLIPGAMIVGVVIVGFWVFNREAPRIAEDL
jgi:ABC-2 type transport system permease protein